MKSNGILAVLLAVLCIVVLSTCFTEWDGGHGGIVPAGFEKVQEQNDWVKDSGTTYTVILTGSDGKFTYGSLSYDEFMALQIPSGTWGIEVWIEDPKNWEHKLKATADKTDVKAGVKNTIYLTTENPPTKDKFIRGFKQLVKSGEGGTLEVQETLDVDSDSDDWSLNGNNKVTISLNESYSGSLFKVTNGGTLTLKNIILEGHNKNNAPLVEVTAGGKLVMNTGSEVTGNGNTSNENNEAIHGGGVRVIQGGTFTMLGGKIYKNNARDGAGVKVTGGSFHMYDGAEIFENIAQTINTGVGITTRGTAGGVHVVKDGSTPGRFYMHGGEIYNNEAYFRGGGVYIGGGCLFDKIGGAIYGDPEEKEKYDGRFNKVIHGEGTVPPKKDTDSHAVYAGDTPYTVKYRKATVGNQETLYVNYTESSSGGIFSKAGDADHWTGTE